MLWDWILAGGFTMATLILLSVISIGVVLERLSFFKQVRRATQSLRTAIQQSFEKKDAERVMMLTMRGEMARLKQYLPILATVASIAPFVGLFGTCKGIIGAFSDISTQGMSGPSVIAAGISEALVSTATGLLVAIPALMFYNYFTKAIANLALELESSAFQVYRDLRQKLAAVPAHH